MKQAAITPTDLTLAPCPDCGVPHEYERCDFLNIVPVCDQCSEKQKLAYEAQKEAAAWNNLWHSRMPPGYRITQRDLVPLNLKPIFEWSQEAHCGGMGLIGKAGSGKSFAMASFIQFHRRGFLWWSGTGARDAAIEAASADRDRDGCRRRWEHGMTVPILVLDDISQGRMTEAWSSKLFDLLETRMSALLPTLWTSQIDLPEMRQKIVRQNGGDAAQAEAISRRLSQHSLILR